MRKAIRALDRAKDDVRVRSKDRAMMYGIPAFALAEVEVEAERSHHPTAVAKPMAGCVLADVPGSPHPFYLDRAHLAWSYPI